MNKRKIVLILFLVSLITTVVLYGCSLSRRFNLGASVSEVLYTTDEIDGKKITLSVDSTSLRLLQTEKITVNIPDKKNHTITWKTSNKNVISLRSSTGKTNTITARSNGKSATVTAIVDGTKKVSIRITTRANQGQRYDLNMIGFGDQDTMYSWWTYPILINDGDADYYSFTTNQGYMGVAKYDKKKKTTVQNYLGQSYKKNQKTGNYYIEIDDHNAPAIYKLADGRILTAFSSGHSKNDELHIRISEKANDVSKFSDDIVLTSDGHTTYSQILYKNNKYYIFHRCGGVKKWCYFSTSNPDKWTNNVVTFITAPEQYYMKLVDTTTPDLVRFLLTFNPTATPEKSENDSGNVRMGFIDFKTGYVYNADYDGKVGSVLGTINDTYNYKNFNIVLKKEDGRATRLFDVAVTDPKDLELAYCTWDYNFSTGKGSKTASYRILRNKNIYTIVDNSYGFWQKYFGGISFIDSNEIVVSSGVENDSDLVSIYKFDEKNNKFKESYYLFKTSNKELYRTLRPIVSYNSSVSFSSDLMWLYGYYNYDKYTEFNTKPFFMSYTPEANTLVAGSTKATDENKKNNKEEQKKKKTEEQKKKQSEEQKKKKTEEQKKKKQEEQKKKQQEEQKKKQQEEQKKKQQEEQKKKQQEEEQKKKQQEEQKKKQQEEQKKKQQEEQKTNGQGSSQNTPTPAPTPKISIKVEGQNRPLSAGCNNANINNPLKFDIVETSGANITKVEYKNSTTDFRVFDASSVSCSGNRCHITMRKNHTDLYIRVTNSRNQNQVIGKYQVCNRPMSVSNEASLSKCAKQVTFTVLERSGAQITSLKYSNTNGNWGLNTAVSYNANKTSASIVMKKPHDKIYFKATNSFGIEQVFGPYKICIK